VTGSAPRLPRCVRLRFFLDSGPRADFVSLRLESDEHLVRRVIDLLEIESVPLHGERIDLRADLAKEIPRRSRFGWRRNVAVGAWIDSMRFKVPRAFSGSAGSSSRSSS